MKFKTSELVSCIDREIRYRMRCYPRWVREGKLQKAHADKEIAMMAAVKDLLTKHMNAERQLPLFGEKE